jgi:hypothetical protein
VVEKWMKFIDIQQIHKTNCLNIEEINHPTSDYPDKAEYLKKQQINQQSMLLESQYSKFKE